jgi:hypothetical protein
MQANEYAFLTFWKVKATAEEVYEILNDVEGYLRWWPESILPLSSLHRGVVTASATPTDC